MRVNLLIKMKVKNKPLINKILPEINLILLVDKLIQKESVLDRSYIITNSDFQLLIGGEINHR
jgi:hypothetical protein